MEQYSNLYSTNLKKKYNQITNQIILENINSIESKISELKNSLENNFENKDFNSFNREKSQKEAKFNSEIFDLGKFSVKKIQENFNNLSQEQKNEIKMQIEHSFFYLNINIDKAFEIFMENFSNKDIAFNNDNNDNDILMREYLERFISRIFELDRIIYVK